MKLTSLTEKITKKKTTNTPLSRHLCVTNIKALRLRVSKDIGRSSFLCQEFYVLCSDSAVGNILKNHLTRSLCDKVLHLVIGKSHADFWKWLWLIPLHSWMLCSCFEVLEKPNYEQLLPWINSVRRQLLCCNQ